MLIVLKERKMVAVYGWVRSKKIPGELKWIDFVIAYRVEPSECDFFTKNV